MHFIFHRKLTYLVLFDILDGKVEPNPEARVARVGPNEQVVFEVGDVVDSAQVAALVAGVEDEVAFARLARIVRRHDGYLVYVARRLLVHELEVAV